VSAATTSKATKANEAAAKRDAIRRSKPLSIAIRRSKPLSIVPLSADRMAVCNVCGKPAEQLEVWRAHDERDARIPGDAAILFLGAGEAHKDCHRKLDAHVRLFAEEDGVAGYLPRLCGPCTFRTGLRCTHPSAKANGGPGLHLEREPNFAIVCFGRGRGGCQRSLRPALTCAERIVKGDAP